MSFAATVTADDLDRDPDPILARLREEEPVAWIPALRMWFVTRWDDVQTMEDHPEIFSAATEPSFLARTLGENMLTLDPPACARIQKACKPPFLRAGRSGLFAERELPAMCDRLIASMRDDGEADIIAGYAALVSAGSLATVLGLDAYDFREVWDWCEGLCVGVANFELEPEAFAVGRRAAEAVEAAVLARLDELRERPEACGLLHILQADQDLSAAEIVNNVRLMISGGINEPRDGIGLVVWTMLADDGLRERALGSPVAMRRLVDEVLRRYTPVGTITRTTTRETELAGVRLPAGVLVSGILRAANLDPARFRDPERLDPTRIEGGNAAFALGVHRCLGEWLGRQEIRVGAERLFRNLPGLRLHPDEEVTLRGFEFRGPQSVRVVWDA